MYLAARLQQAGMPVTLVARGAAFDTIRTRGLTVVESDGRSTLDVHAESDAAAVGPVDVLFVGVKAHQLVSAIPAINQLTGPQTAVVYLQNGIPWWYGYRHPIAAEWALDAVDPGGVLARSLDAARALGCIVYFAANVPEPGVVAHSSGVKLILGEAGDGRTPRLERIAALLRTAGFDVAESEHIRRDVWQKLLGNMSFNPVTALTRTFIAEAATDAGAISIVRAMMGEGLAVAAALGDAPAIKVDQRIAMSPLVGLVRTSTLQDVEAGRPMEIGPLVGAVVELGARLGVPTPATRRTHGLVALLDRTLAAAR
jgi:2-dehydropantoate 2-reductase